MLHSRSPLSYKYVGIAGQAEGSWCYDTHCQIWKYSLLIDRIQRPVSFCYHSEEMKIIHSVEIESNPQLLPKHFIPINTFKNI